ncbi:MAG: methyltransferase family protein [Thermotogota bacterium]
MSKEIFQKADFFPPTIGVEKFSLWIYQTTTLLLMIFLFFYDVKFENTISYFGLVVYILGIVLYLKSVHDFSKPEGTNFSKYGLYKISRNPMYVSFFIYFLGVSLILNSWIYLAILIILQISVHFIILSEERWCLKEFGDEYNKYMQNVRRYF